LPPGPIDIYVFDQLLRERTIRDMKVLDAGCGGRNSEYLMRCEAEVFGVDAEPDHVARIRKTARTAAPSRAAPAGMNLTQTLTQPRDDTGPEDHDSPCRTRAPAPMTRVGIEPTTY